MSRLWNLPVFAAAVLFAAGYAFAQAPENNAAEQPAASQDAQSQDKDNQKDDQKEAQENAAQKSAEQNNATQERVESDDPATRERESAQERQDRPEAAPPAPSATPPAPRPQAQPSPAPARVDGVRETIPGTTPPRRDAEREQAQPATPTQPQDPARVQPPRQAAPPVQPQTPEAAAPGQQRRDDARQDRTERRQDRTDRTDRADRQDRTDRADQTDRTQRTDESTRTQRTEQSTRTETQRTERMQREGRQQVDLGWKLDSQDDRLVIQSIDENSPLANTELKEGDEIISINGRQFQSADELERFMRQSQQRQAQIVVRRDGEQHTYRVNMPQQMMDQREQFGQQRAGEQQFGQRQMRQGQAQGRQAAMGVWIDTARPGLYIMGLPENSPAAQAGLRSGDRIISVDGRRFDSAQALISHLSNMDADSTVEIEYMRNGQIFAAECQLGQRGDIYGQTTYTQAPAPQGWQGQQEYSAMRPQTGEANVQQLKAEVDNLKRQVEQLRSELHRMKMNGAGRHETGTEFREDFRSETHQGIQQRQDFQNQGQQPFQQPGQRQFQGTRPAPPAPPAPQGQPQQFDRDQGAVIPPTVDDQPGAAPQGARPAPPAPRSDDQSDDQSDNNDRQRDNRDNNQDNDNQNDQ